MKPIKLCFCASSGGHYWELLQLSELAQKYDSFLITEKTEFNIEPFCKNFYLTDALNRKSWNFLFKLLVTTFCIFKILLKEKPAVIISTGALVTFPIMLIGKCMNAKIIYVESFVRVDSKSLTGKLIHPFVDLFIVQWRKALKVYPRAIFGGQIY